MLLLCLMSFYFCYPIPNAKKKIICRQDVANNRNYLEKVLDLVYCADAVCAVGSCRRR